VTDPLDRFRHETLAFRVGATASERPGVTYYAVPGTYAAPNGDLRPTLVPDTGQRFDYLTFKEAQALLKTCRAIKQWCGGATCLIPGDPGGASHRDDPGDVQIDLYQFVVEEALPLGGDAP
jgi:hypothetical protein